MAGRPRGIRPTAKERGAGYGRVGYCKVCAHDGAQFLNAAIVRAEADEKPMTAKDMLAYMRMLDPEFNYDRHGFYKHKSDHLTSPLITAVEKTRRESPKILPKSNSEALEMVRDLGMQSAIDNPESIGVDHALRAIDVMEKKSKGPEALWVLLSRVQGGERPAEIIMGEYKELETSEPQEAEVQ